ncbi:hypothetical protein [Caulobacter phage Cr30]|uniref:hypothetical protein n=1 Tax=Caulobacter phage Cr30 TaxID=1357714 RepID=UPI0004A9B42C|nr:hypothetical protein OZ74_gp252 [Caulobacter phage Cr30]AGS81091.1 hypothetical protein [Caulobacter phage Cr30]
MFKSDAFTRDKKSKALISIDDGALERRKKFRAKLKEQEMISERIEKLEQEVSFLKKFIENKFGVLE